MGYTILIQRDRDVPGTYEGNFSEEWCAYLRDWGHEPILVDLTQPDLPDEIHQADGVMWRFIHVQPEEFIARRALMTIEHYLDIPVWPSLSTRWPYNDKISQLYLFKALGIPIPETWVFCDPAEALAFAEHAKYPMVCKHARGAGSAAVSLVRNKQEAEEAIQRLTEPTLANLPTKSRLHGLDRWKAAWRLATKKQMPDLAFKDEYGLVAFQPHVIFQEFLEGNTYDTRATLISDEAAFAFRRWNRPDDFRASGSGKAARKPEEVDPRFLRLAFDVSNKIGISPVAIDGLYRGGPDGEVVVGEISYTFCLKTKAYTIFEPTDDPLVFKHIPLDEPMPIARHTLQVFLQRIENHKRRQKS